MTKEARKIVKALANKVKVIESLYTGGNIYIYRAELKDGTFALGATLCETHYVDASPFEVNLYDSEDCDLEWEWIGAHSIGCETIDEYGEYDDEWDMDDVWAELEKKYKPTQDGYDGHGERIVTK